MLLCNSRFYILFMNVFCTKMLATRQIRPGAGASAWYSRMQYLRFSKRSRKSTLWLSGQKRSGPAGRSVFLYSLFTHVSNCTATRFCWSRLSHYIPDACMKIHYFFVAARRGNAPTRVSVLRVCVFRVTKRLPVPYRRHIIIKYH